MVDGDTSRRIIYELDSDQSCPTDVVSQSIGPLDCEDAVAHTRFLQPEIFSRRVVEAVQIRMVERQSAAAIFVEQRECRTTDFRRIDSQSRSQPFDERGLAGTEIAGKQQHIAWFERRREFVRDSLRFFFRSGNQLRTLLFRIAQPVERITQMRDHIGRRHRDLPLVGFSKIARGAV